MSENPLAQYFRKPVFFLELPSKGKYYPDGSIELTKTGEFPVYPMTALDDITYKTPDALFNGSAVVDIIKSCIPSITDPWNLPTIDLNHILAAIRIASLGSEMEIESMCPKCKEVADYSIDLRGLLDKEVEVSLYAAALEIGPLNVYFKPLSYYEVNENNKIQFKEDQLQQILTDDEVPHEQKIKLIADAFKEISEISVNTIAMSIFSIKTPDEEVNDNAFIKEFLGNCKSDVFESIKNRLFKLKELEDLAPVKIKCDNEECKNEYDQPFTLDMTTFFERNS